VLEYDRIQELKRDASTLDQYDVKKHDVALSITQSEIDFFKKTFLSTIESTQIGLKLKSNNLSIKFYQ